MTMRGAVAKVKREILPLEEATSYEEFRARYSAELHREYEVHDSPWKFLWVPVGALFMLIDILTWIAVAKASSPGRWVALAFALVFIPLTLWACDKGPSRGRPVTPRTLELDKLLEQWAARADSGEIPRTTPGGPKVWRDQLTSSGSPGLP